MLLPGGGPVWQSNARRLRQRASRQPSAACRPRAARGPAPLCAAGGHLPRPVMRRPPCPARGGARQVRPAAPIRIKLRLSSR
jgi:hypothetical protein